MTLNLLKILFITLIVILLHGCSQNLKEDGTLLEYNDSIVCDLEKISPDSTCFLTNNNMFKFKGAENKSEEKAHSGKYSIKLSSQNQYGLTIELDNINPDDYLTLGIWEYGESKVSGLVVSDDSSKIVYYKFSDSDYTDYKGWNYISGEVFIPPIFNTKKLHIYLSVTDSLPIYFDDIVICRKKNKIYPDYTDVDNLKLYILPEGIEKLQKLRLNAFKKGVLSSDNNEWVDAKMVFQDKEYKIALRLKGDWLDHLSGEKWSFRIKVNKENTFQGMAVFSIQNPESRYFLKEFLLYHSARLFGIFVRLLPLKMALDRVYLFVHHQTL